ncbi:MAG TPA: heavy metal translocating P-type ATPase [Steroidobacteraceae bacterium]|nr:heavy metal translocating P-type ATPase [Steroidobacteraceae bacterium]
MTERVSCFHCGEAVAPRQVHYARIGDRDEPVCCAGCRAVAELIAGAGLADFYRYRCGPSERPGSEPSSADEWSAYARSELEAAVSRRLENGHRAITLVIDGVRCAACAWLIDRILRMTDGIEEISVNAATARARVVWDPRTVGLDSILRGIHAVGYRPHPVTSPGAQQAADSERAAALKRLAVAGLGMMQVMMFAVALYAGDFAGMDETVRSYLRIVSMLVATPVLFYAGRPFFRGAYHALRLRTIGMDVPVSLALALAYGASVINVMRGAGEVYFDSVTMFVFFLTVGRFVEMLARHRTSALTDALARLSPVVAHRLRDGSVDDIPVAQLALGETVLVRSGERVPADGLVVDSEGRLDESMLTGESLPAVRRAGERVMAGSVNLGDPLKVEVTAIGSATVLAGVVNLLERAQTEKPRVALAADRAAAWLLARALVATAVVCSIWLVVDPSRAFDVTLAVLVVTCPCALSLATPAAMAAVSGRLARDGVLVTSPDAIEHLARANSIVFDKTGTLTRGLVRIEDCTGFGALSPDACLEVAAALERASEHPIARAFAAVPGKTAEHVVVHPGRGITGTVGGRNVRIGSADFVGAAAVPPDQGGASRIYLADEEGLLASFRIADTLRPEAPAVIEELSALGLEPSILSGDSSDAVAAVARRCAISHFESNCLPADKLERIVALEGRGAVVAMVGDGVNDAPVLKRAHVSIAMGSGSALAQSSADLLLMGDSLAPLGRAVGTARQALKVVRQNLIWAAAYNLSALPLAALGFVPPWLAAIGMSASSVLVILNAMRLAPRVSRNSRMQPEPATLTVASA